VSRSACWKACLLFHDLNTAEWASISKTSRETFNSLQSRYLRNISNPDEVESFDDPLGEDSNVSRITELVPNFSLSDQSLKPREVNLGELTPR